MDKWMAVGGQERALGPRAKKLGLNPEGLQVQ